MGCFRQMYRQATVRHSHAILHFFFFLILLFSLKFESLLHCAYVRYFHFCPESLVARSVQLVSLFEKGWMNVDCEGGRVVSCEIITIFIYIFTIIYMFQFYTVACLSFAALWLFIFLFLLWFRYPPIFVCFFCAYLLCLFGGQPCSISTQCLQSVH